MRKSLTATSYPGVGFYTDANGQKLFYIRYRRGGRGAKQIFEPVGKSSEGMTAKKASLIRADRMRGALSNRELKAKAAEKQESNLDTDVAVPARWTLNNLWEAYQEANPKRKFNRSREISVYDTRIRKVFGNKTIDELSTLALDKYRNSLLQKGLSPSTVRNAMELIRRLFNFGAKHGHCVVPQTLQFNYPRVDDQKTEVLNDDELQRFENALQEYASNKYLEEKDYYVAYAHLIMHTGIRRAAAVALRWDDCDFDRGFITLRGSSAKSGKTQMIPMSPYVRQLLLHLPHGNGDFIFPQRHVDTYSKYYRRVCDLAGLPKDFRPIHGFRHNFASRVASSGQVDMYTLQNLMTHSSPRMTQRYAHLADKAMHKAAAVIDDVMKVHLAIAQDDGGTAVA